MGGCGRSLDQTLMGIARATSDRSPTSLLRKRLREERGVAMVEFVMLLPVLLMSIVGNSVRACVTAKVHFLGLLGLSDVTITQSATMRIEQTQTSTIWSTDTPPSQCPTT